MSGARRAKRPAARVAGGAAIMTSRRAAREAA